MPLAWFSRVDATAADGSRFLIATPIEQTAPQTLTVVLNWQAKLKEIAAPGMDTVRLSRRDDMGDSANEQCTKHSIHQDERVAAQPIVLNYVCLR